MKGEFRAGGGGAGVVPPDEGLSLAQNPEIPPNVVGGRQREVLPGGGWKMLLKFRWDFASPSPYNSPPCPQISSLLVPK